MSTQPIAAMPENSTTISDPGTAFCASNLFNNSAVELSLEIDDYYPSGPPVPWWFNATSTTGLFAHLPPSWQDSEATFSFVCVYHDFWTNLSYPAAVADEDGLYSGEFRLTITLTSGVVAGGGSGQSIELQTNSFSASGEKHLYDYVSLTQPVETIIGRLAEVAQTTPAQPALPLPAVTIRTTPTQPNHARPWERQSYKIETLNPSGTVLTKEMEVTYSTAFNGQLSAVSADVRHESAFAPNAPNPLKNFNFTYDYTEIGNASLLSKRYGPVTDVPNGSGGFKRAYTSTHSYLPGRNELHKLENALNVGRVTNSSTTPMTRAYGAWTASTHGYAVNHLRQRTLHQQDLKRYGNWNSNLYDRRADRTYGYNDRGELATATSTYPNGFAPDAFLYQPVSETESYTYDAIGNRKTATVAKRPINNNTNNTLAGEFQFGWLPGGTGESVTYSEASNANTYTTITKTNTNNPSNTGGTLTVTQKHDADGNLTDDGEFLYKYDAENRLIAVDPKVLQSGYGEAGFRYAYDHLHRRIRRQVVWWCGAWPLPTQEISHFVYRGWNLALHIHQDYMCYNDTVGTVVGLDMGNYANGLSSRRTDRYVWGRDVSGSLQGAGGVGGLLMCVANPKHSVLWVADAMLPSMAYYFLYDGNGNVSETIHERGAVLGQYRYDDFGKLMGQNPTHYVTAVNGIDQIYSGINQPFKFSTKWHDDTNHNSASYGPYHRSRSLVCYGYRMYSPDMGRWLGRDPTEEEGGLNLFGMIVSASSDKAFLSPQIVLGDTWVPDGNSLGKLVRQINLRASLLGKWCLDLLVIRAHGSTEEMLFHYSYQDPSLIQYWRPGLPPLRELTPDINLVDGRNAAEVGKYLKSNIEFCRPCRIVLGSCYSAGNEPGRAHFAAQIARETGCTVSTVREKCWVDPMNPLDINVGGAPRKGLVPFDSKRRDFFPDGGYFDFGKGPLRIQGKS